MKKYLIKQDLYEVELAILVESKWEEVEKYVLRKYGVVLDTGPDIDGGFFRIEHDDHEHYYMWLANEEEATQTRKIGILSHELLHFTSYVLNTRGLPLVRESEEAYTYFHQYFLEKVLDKLKILS